MPQLIGFWIDRKGRAGRVFQSGERVLLSETRYPNLPAAINALSGYVPSDCRLFWGEVDLNVIHPRWPSDSEAQDILAQSIIQIIGAGGCPLIR